jgi:hypothetical protein
MTLAFDDRYIKYSPVVSTDTFIVPFPIYSADDLGVIVDGVETTEYSVTATFVDGVCEDAEIVLVSAVDDVDVEIYGNREPRAVGRYVGNSPNLASQLEIDVERLTAVQQELYRDMGRAAKVPLGSTFDPVLPDPIEGAILIGTADGWENGPTVDSLVTAPSSQNRFTTIEELKAYTGDALVVGSTVEILRGGHSLEVVSSGQHWTTDGGDKVKVLAGPDGSANFLAFAPAADGVTDDSPVMQIAVDSGIKEIVVPAGTYAWGSYVDVDSVDDLTIRGVGRPVIKLLAGLSDSSAFNVSIFRFTECVNVTVTGLTIDGSRADYATVNTYLANADNFRVFWIVGCVNVVITDNIFEDWQGVVVKVVALGATGGSTAAQIRADAAREGVDGLKVIGNKFSYCGTAVQVNPSSSYFIYVQNNTIFNTDYSAVTIYPHGYGVFVNDNTMVEIGKVTTGPLSGDGYAIRYYECAGGVISGNQINDCDFGIVLLYGAVDFVCRDIGIHDNTIIDTSQYLTANGGAICVTGNRLRITGNTINESASSAKYIGVELEGVDILFDGNSMTYTPSGAGQSFRVGYDALHGAGTHTNQNIRITNNKIAVTSGAYGVLMNSSATIDGVYMGGNVITGWSTAEVYDPNAVVIYEVTGSKAAAAPTAGTWKRGDIVYNSAPSAGSVFGWVCITAGTPGTWVPFAGVQPGSTYTVTNPSTDRTLDVSGDTTAQVAAVLGTLIADLKANGVLK